jgi:hypothetical protein
MSHLIRSLVEPGGAAVLGFVITNVLPETSGRSLEEFSGEGHSPQPETSTAQTP